MPQVFANISMSLDGYVAGPEPTLEAPLGIGGERIHEWGTAAMSWREQHGLDGGEANADSDVIAQSIARTGATIMGRRMFSGGSGPWDDDAMARGWWGDDPPFHHPVFVLTHHARDPLVMEGGTTFTFVKDGPDAALELAIAAAGDKDVSVSGGANVIQQYLNGRHLDELHLHIAPVFLRGGTSLFANVAPDVRIEPTSVLSSPMVTHVSYRVAR